MKTHLLCAAALGLAGIAGAASAQDSDTFIVKSKVTPFCANLAAAAPTLALGELADANGFVVTAFAGDTSHNVPGYYCNGPATVTLSAGPLLQTAGDPVPDSTSFTNRVDYRASLTWDNVSGSVDSADNAPADIASAEANIGELIVSVSNPDTTGNLRPIAGEYEGAVTLTIVLQP